MSKYKSEFLKCIGRSGVHNDWFKLYLLENEWEEKKACGSKLSLEFPLVPGTKKYYVTK